MNLTDLEDQGTLGEGKFAIVKKFRHRKTGVIMAVKVCPFPELFAVNLVVGSLTFPSPIRQRIHFDSQESTFKNVVTELSVLHDHRSPYIVDFYGAFFIETHVYYCVEYMDLGSLDKVRPDPFFFCDALRGFSPCHLLFITCLPACFSLSRGGSC